MAQSLQERYLDAYPRFLDVIPMDDVRFRAELTRAGLFSGDSREAVIAKSTKAEKVELFLIKCIDPGFSEDGSSNELLDKLLTVMEKNSFLPVKQLAKDVRGSAVPSGRPPSKNTTVSASNRGAPFGSNKLDEKPNFQDLKTKFERVADWEAVCPYLINDDDGQKTKKIRKNRNDIDEKRNEMLELFLQDVPNPTWRLVLAALRNGKYTNLADEIEKELQG